MTDDSQQQMTMKDSCYVVTVSNHAENKIGNPNFIFCSDPQMPSKEEKESKMQDIRRKSRLTSELSKIKNLDFQFQSAQKSNMHINWTYLTKLRISKFYFYLQLIRSLVRYVFN